MPLTQTKCHQIPRQLLRCHSVRSRFQFRRSYYSQEFPQPPPFPRSESAILSAALAHVPAHGFTQIALAAGARDAGYLDITTNLFPAGAAVALINYHLVTQRLAVSNAFRPTSTSTSFSTDPKTSTSSPSAPPQQQQKDAPIQNQIRTLTLHRLRANAPIIQHWQSALAILAQPANVPLSVRELARLADEILFLAGSTTVSGAWYTDRAGLAGLYAAAELFMTQDRSVGFRDTEEFVDRRLREAEGLRDGLGMLGVWVRGQAGGLLDGLRSKGVWV